MAWVEQVGYESWRVRYSTDAGGIGSIGGFRSQHAAQTAAVLVEADRDRGRWIDPSAGRITVAEWSERWWPTINVAERTEENYRRRLDRHLLPRWGAQRLCDITPAQVTTWARDFEMAGYARSTISSQLKLLSMMLTDAVDARLIAANPVRRRRRRGRHLHGAHVERVWATPEQVVQIAARACDLGGPGAAALIVTAAWTGARWGELTGLHRHNLHLTDHQIVIDPVAGALHESGTRLWLGPPKTSASVRRITLPPFLVQVLRAHLRMNDSPLVFATNDGAWHRRSNFSRRVLRPAADGTSTPGARLTSPIRLGLTFHGLRHSHKTWLIADGAPEIAQARRLGHHLDNRVVETYSHVAPEVERRLIRALERRWHSAIAAVPEGGALQSSLGLTDTKRRRY